ncbi:hypothetical protein thalar_02487 [Litoreibacter arenae DSM 19593]|uniref:Uncharacterized protein n=1 Tax=Litoreibacter arenae DSM 19593 TaxID=1123360 RepID=S9QF89_9RHOB|nr:hypothetical protein thalar_02487 [Litoreibacter arenae DSM 19593]
MIALDEVFASLLADVPNAVEMSVTAVINFVDDTPIAGGFVCDDGDRAMHPHAFDGLVHKGFCCP